MQIHELELTCGHSLWTHSKRDANAYWQAGISCKRCPDAVPVRWRCHDPSNTALADVLNGKPMATVGKPVILGLNLPALAEAGEIPPEGKDRLSPQITRKGQ